MPRSFAGRLAAALLLGACSSLASAQGPDELWEVDMKMEMAGMPVPMPSMAQRVCQPKARTEDRMVPMDSNCRMLESKRSGSRFTFKFRCEGDGNDYAGTGEMEYQGRDAYKGRMTAKGKMKGEVVDMATQWSGKRVGSCTYEDPSKKQDQMMAQVNAEVAKACDQVIEDLVTSMVVGESAMCGDRRADFCARAAKVEQDLRSPAGFDLHAQRDWRSALAACGRDPAPIVKQACGRALESRDGAFLQKHCPDDAVAARRQFCLGRTYTSVDPAARELCSALGGFSDTADAPAAAPSAAPASAPASDGKGSIVDKLKEGADRLKKFLKF
jgi:hypothetical protein